MTSYLINKQCRECQSSLLETLQMVEIVTVIRTTPVNGIDEMYGDGTFLPDYEYDDVKEEDSFKDPVERYYECCQCGTPVELEDIPSLFGVAT